MGELLEEVKIWNTPVVGAFLLWKFTQGYINEHKHHDAPVAILHFVATAILTSEKLKAPISNKRENLQSYVRSFEDMKDSDLLLSIQERVKDKSHYTWNSLDIAVASGLLFWDLPNGKLYSKSLLKSPSRGNNPKLLMKKDGERAEILGKWFAQHEISTIASYLKILF